MTCSRCGAAMHEAIARERGSRPILLWACVCGERMDDTIWFNRQFHRTETTAERNERILRAFLRECALAGVA